MTTTPTSSPGPLHSLDAPLGTDLPTSEDCSEREAVAPLLGTRLDLATAAAAEAGMVLTLLGTVPYMDAAPPPNYRTEGQSAAQVISDMLLASNPRVWYAPGEVVIDGRILPTVATTSDPEDLLAAEDRASDGAAYTEVAAESEPEPLLADYLERCERRDESNPSSGGTFETFDTGVYEWVTRGGTGGDYQETTHELEKEDGRLTREAEETDGYFEPFDGATYWGTVSRSEITNEYHPICPEALVARSEFTMQRKRRSDLSRFSGVEEADGGAPWSRSTEDLLYDAIPTWYRQKTVDVEQAWHAEGWLRTRISTARELEGMVAAPVRDAAGDITGYNVTLLYRRETREETYTPIGDGLWHIATTIRTTEQQPVYEPVNPDAVDGDPDYGLVELVGVQPVPVSNAYTVTTDQAPPSISCGDPCEASGYDGCVAEQTARWEEDHANWEARQARNGQRRIWTVTANHLLPGVHLGQLVAGGVVTSVSHERDFTAGGSTFEVTQWIA